MSRSFFSILLLYEKNEKHDHKTIQVSHKYSFSKYTLKYDVINGIKKQYNFIQKILWNNTENEWTTIEM